MNNKTSLRYLLSAHRYYQAANTRHMKQIIKHESNKEIEYFFNHRHKRFEPWHKRYQKILIAVLSVNLLARQIERQLYHQYSTYDFKYNRFAHPTLIAIREFNNNRSAFAIQVDPERFLTHLLHLINQKVNTYCQHKKFDIDSTEIIHSNTPMGIELEFSNRGVHAGYFFESGNSDALLNFSKYHHYHLMKFMWRYGAYVDSNTPLKQFVKKGGFLEYTFTRPDSVFLPSEPLTASPELAAATINEAVRFTPVRPHSLHVSLEIVKTVKRPHIPFQNVLFLLICTGHFQFRNGQWIESRLTEGNMKELAIVRDRRNDNGWVVTIEFTHMRLCREFVRRKTYFPALNLLLAYKNLFSFSNIDLYSKKLSEWARSPYPLQKSEYDFLQQVKTGLDLEPSLPSEYKVTVVQQISALYRHNSQFLQAEMPHHN